MTLEQLKERASIGLQKLGAQVFSSEPGGYGLSNWMTSFNLLLDDFEEKCKPSVLPKEYYDSRLKQSSQLLEPVDSTQEDSEIESLEKEIGSVEEKIADIVQKSERHAVDEWHEDDAKIIRLKKERTQIDIELAESRADLEEAKRKANQSVFKRLFSSADSIKPLQMKLDELSLRQEDIEDELHSLEEDRLRMKNEVKKFDSDISELRSTLEGTRARLGEVQARKLDLMQIVERRREVANSMSAMISSLHLDQGPTESEKETVNG